MGRLASAQLLQSDAAATALAITQSHLLSQDVLGSDLTPREREILPLLVAGKTNKEMALAFHVTLSTIRQHVSNILSKLGASNRTEAATLALQHNLVSRDV